jgi:hypothetical protein
MKKKESMKMEQREARWVSSKKKKPHPIKSPLSSSSSTSLNDSHDGPFSQASRRFEEINKESEDFKLAFKNTSERRKMLTRNEQLRAMLEPHKVIVFPSPGTTTWNGLPRFNFVEANMKTVDNHTLDLKLRKRQQARIDKQKATQAFYDRSIPMQGNQIKDEQEPKKKEKKRVDFKIAKNVIELYGILNDISMQQMPDKRKPPASECLNITKAQHTKLAAERSSINRQEYEQKLRELYASDKAEIRVVNKD